MGKHRWGLGGAVPSIHHVTRRLAPRLRSTIPAPYPRPPEREKSRALCALFFAALCAARGRRGERPHDFRKGATR